MTEEAIFHEVLARDPADRGAYLDRACAGDPTLRAAVEALLRANVGATGFLESPPAGTGATIDAPSREGPGTALGPYKLLQQIGEGGMGTVYMAEQTAPVQRKVALKLIKPGMDSRQVIARFEAERQALALMDHPNIAKVLDAGATAGGRPYFVMELVKGVPITKYCDDYHLMPRQRLELFVPVCQAVQHAHQKGIIHRDIKPSNVLVCIYDGKPAPKVIDFGVAKAAGPRLTEKTLYTEFGSIVGTVEYMSPEQAQLDQLDIDTRSDIYSLGVLLYELLTGTTPLDRKRITTAAVLELLRLVREEEPPRPSTRLNTTEELASIAANRGMEPKKLSGLMRGELDWIVMKALDKNRNRRYETANGLAHDVERYLANEPVRACPPSTWYRFRKFARRNKAALTMASLLALAFMIALGALAAGTVVTSRAYAAEKLAHSRAEANFRRARGAVHDFFTTVSQSKLLDVPGVQPVRQDLLESAVRYYQGLAWEREVDPTIQADLAVSHLRLAEVYYEVGKNNQAITSVNAGLDVAEPLVQHHPDDPDLLRRLAGFWRGTRRRSGSAPGPNDVVAAESTVNRFIQIWQTLCDRNPSERAFRSDLAAMYHRLAQLLDIAERRPEAMAAAEKSAAVWDALIRDYPEELEYVSAQGDAFNFLRFLARETGQPQRAAEFARKAFDAAEKLAAGNPAAPPYREDIANHLMAQAGALRAQNKTADAEKQFRRALAVWEKLANEYPMNVHYRTQLLASCGNLAAMLTSMGQLDEAERFRLRFAEILDKGVADFPAEPEEMATFADVIRQTGLLVEGTRDRESLYRQARGIYEKLIERYPDNPSYQMKLAWLHAGFGTQLSKQPGGQRKAVRHFRDAASIVEKLAAGSPAQFRQQLADRHGDLVGILRATGQQKEAAKVYQWDADFYEKLTAQFPMNLEYRSLLSESRMHVHIHLGEWDEALRAYQEAANLATTADGVQRLRIASVLRGVARGLQEEGKLAECVPAHQQAAAVLEKCIVDGAGNNSLNGIRDDLANVYAYLGLALRDLHRFDEAVEAERKAIELWKRLGQADPHREWYPHEEAFFSSVLADLLQSMGRSQDALEYARAGVQLLEQLADRFPGNKDHYVERLDGSRGIWLKVLQSLGRLDEAVAADRKACELNPGNAVCFRRLARTEAMLGRWTDAVNNFSKALGLNASDWECWDDRGVAYLNANQPAKALADFSKSLGLSPKAVSVWRHRGAAYTQLGQWDKAAADLSKVVETVPDNAEDQNNFAWLLATCPDSKVRDLPRALERAKRAVGLAPKQGNVWNTLGVAQYYAGDQKAAIDALNKSIELQNGGNSFDWFFLAMARWQLGDRNEARRWFDQAVEWMEKNAPKNDELLRFRTEAAKTLELQK